MLKLISLTDDNFYSIEKYINYTPEFCDFTLGVKYIWKNAFKTEFAEIDDTLILKESYKDFLTAFYFPIGKNVDNALRLIEEWCVENETPLEFCYLGKEQKEYLENRYGGGTTFFYREWCDYIYPASEFIEYSGKKMSGQRNHLHKFTRLYPDYKFKVIEKQDLNRVLEFIKDYEHETVSDAWSKDEELKMLDLYVKNTFKLRQVGGYVEVNGKIVALSIGEKIGKNMIIHVEKGLKEYEGVYPTVAHEFAKAFTVKGDIINREEDCGDMGLRTSKMQYHPVEIRQKYHFKPKTSFFNEDVNIKGERIVLRSLKEKDKKEYYDIFTDDKLNALWGYDYKTDLKGNVDCDRVFEFSEKLRDKKLERSIVIEKDGKMIGEIVLWNFDYSGGVEIGFRITEKYQRNGYVKEGLKILIPYLSKNRGIVKIKARCIDKNAPSYNLLTSFGFKAVNKTDEFYFFSL